MSEEEKALDVPRDNATYAPIEYVVKVKRPSLIRRIGCGFLIVIWFLILLLPAVMIVLAVEGDITIAHGGDVPDKHEHPRFQVHLVMEIDFRGLQITNTSLNYVSDENLCIQTNVRYVLWQGQGDPATYCDCYTRPDADADWQFEETILDSC